MIRTEPVGIKAALMRIESMVNGIDNNLSRVLASLQGDQTSPREPHPSTDTISGLLLKIESDLNTISQQSAALVEFIG